ncbi:hypothetical protein D3C75_1118240 [compost metagenome]
MSNSFVIHDINRILTLMLLSNFNSFNQTCTCKLTHAAVHFCINGMQFHFHFFFTSYLYKLLNHRYDVFDLVMSEHDCFKHHFFW